MNKFLEYLESNRQAINWADVGRRAGIGPRGMAKHFGGFQPLSDRRYADLVRALCETTGCVKIGGWMIEWSGTAFVTSQQTGEPEAIEKPDEKGNVAFEYRMPMRQEVYDSFDMNEFLKSI